MGTGRRRRRVAQCGEGPYPYRIRTVSSVTGSQKSDVSCMGLHASLHGELHADSKSGGRNRFLEILAMRGRATPLVIAFSLIAPDVQASAQDDQAGGAREVAHEAYLLARFEPLLG